MEIEQGKQYQIAAMPTRLLNYIIDQSVFVMLILAHPYVGINIKLEDLQKASPSMLMYLMLLNTAYYLICELAFSKTIGKMITRTRVVDTEGEKPKPATVIIRSLCRNLPLDNVSFLLFAKGWHDQLSNTTVVHDAYKQG